MKAGNSVKSIDEWMDGWKEIDKIDYLSFTRHHRLWSPMDRASIHRCDGWWMDSGQTTYLSLWNFKLCTTSGVFCCRKFHKCMVSSAVALTSAPSLTRNSIFVTAHADSPSWRTWLSTPGLPNLWLFRKKQGFVENVCVKENKGWL